MFLYPPHITEYLPDGLWDALEAPVSSPDSETASQPGGRFALERQLEDFLLENWDRTKLAGQWAIYSTSEEPEAGNQSPTDVGRIDVLAVHKTQPRLLVVELKRNQSTGTTGGGISPLAVRILCRCRRGRHM